MPAGVQDCAKVSAQLHTSLLSAASQQGARVGRGGGGTAAGSGGQLASCLCVFLPITWPFIPQRVDVCQVMLAAGGC